MNIGTVKRNLSIVVYPALFVPLLLLVWFSVWVSDKVNYVSNQWYDPRTDTTWGSHARIEGPYTGMLDILLPALTYLIMFLILWYGSIMLRRIEGRAGVSFLDHFRYCALLYVYSLWIYFGPFMHEQGSPGLAILGFILGGMILVNIVFLMSQHIANKLNK